MAPSDALNTFAVCLSYLGFSNARRVVVHVWRELGGPVLSLHVYRPCLLKWPPGPAAGQCCHYGKGIRVCQGVGTLEGSSLNCVPLAGGPVRGRTSLTSAPHHPKEGQAWLGGCRLCILLPSAWAWSLRASHPAASRCGGGVCGSCCFLFWAQEVFSGNPRTRRGVWLVWEGLSWPRVATVGSRLAVGSPGPHRAVCGREGQARPC